MRALILALCLLLPLPVSAAQSPVGKWRIDQRSLEASVDRLITTLAARLPEDQRDQARQSMNAQRAAMRRQMAASVATTIEFLADGTVIFDEPGSHGSERGKWRQEGNDLHVADADPESPDLDGVVAASRIELHFDVGQGNPDQAPLADLIWVLVPAN